MATPMVHPSSHHHVEADNNSSSRSQSSCSNSQPDIFNAKSQTDVSSVSEGSFSAAAGSGSFDGSSLDSIGQMLIRLDDNDASLTELLIDCKSMDTQAATYVEQFLPKNTYLQKLRLHCGSRSDHREIIHRVLSGLKGNSSIESLEIQDAEINRETASWLVPFLAQSRTLKHISVMNCNFVGSSLATLFVAMQHNKHIRQLTFHSIAGHRQVFHRIVFRRVLSGLKGNSTIESLEIQGAEIDGEIASWLLPFLANRQTLKRISMMNCRGPGLEVLFVAMQHNKHIRELTFHSCHWEEHIADIVASSLPFMSLRSLSLVDITIAVDGWPYLFHKLIDCTELTRLDLSRNKLDASSIYLLTKSLTAQQQISKLSLSSCRLDDKCMKELAKGLRNYSTLTSLDISNNKKMTDKGVIYLKDLLNFNNSITDLKVDRYGLNTRSTNEIESGLRYNTSFLKCFFSFAIYDFVDSIVTPQRGKNEENDAESALEPAAVDNDPIMDGRDADETNATTYVEDERSPPDDAVVKANDDDSIMTEVYSIQETRGKVSARSRKER